jgi:hypothetical protein
MSKEPKKVSTLEDWPLGVLPDGSMNIVNKDDPPFKPTIVDEDGNVVEDPDDE